MMPALRIMVSEVLATGSVLYQLVRQQLVLRYRRTVLGYFWTLVNPLMMMSITAAVFSNLFKVELHTFAIFLFSGMVPWNFFSAAVTQSSGAFIMNEGLIKKIYIPKILFPLSVLLSSLIDSVLSLAALFVIILIIGGQASWALLFLPVAYMLLFCFALGAALIISVAAAFYRDLQHVIVIAMQALFFLTPIIYDKSAMVGGIAILLHINPLTPFVELFRAPIRYGMWPELGTIAYATGITLCSLVIGLYFFLRMEKKIVFRL